MGYARNRRMDIEGIENGISGFKKTVSMYESRD